MSDFGPDFKHEFVRGRVAFLEFSKKQRLRSSKPSATAGSELAMTAGVVGFQSWGKGRGAALEAWLPVSCFEVFGSWHSPFLYLLFSCSCPHKRGRVPSKAADRRSSREPRSSPVPRECNPQNNSRSPMNQRCRFSPPRLWKERHLWLPLRDLGRRNRAHTGKSRHQPCHIPAEQKIVMIPVGRASWR
jgi:hypothetical protein